MTQLSEARRAGSAASGAIVWVVAWTSAIVAVLVTMASAADALQLTGIPDPGAVTTYGLPALQTLGEVAAAITIGAAAFAAFFTPPQSDGTLDVGGYRAIRLAASAAVAWAVCAVLLIPLSLSQVSGQPLSDSLSPAKWGDALSQVADARSWLWTATFALVAAVMARMTLHWGWTVPVLGAGVLSLFPLALAGHSSAGGNHDLATNSLILHVVAASVWMGGLIVVLLYGRTRQVDTALAVRRFSRVAFWCIAVVGLSGVVNALVRVHLDQLFTTTYGRLVLLKVLALAVLGGLGAVHRRTSVTALTRDASDVAPFIRFATVEVVVFAATFGLAVGLSRTPPPPTTGGAELSVPEVELGYRIDHPPTLSRLVGDWRFDLIYGTAAVLLAAVYLRGVLRLRRRGDHWPLGRTVAFLLGCLLLLTATSSGLGRYAPAMFSMHMIAHMLLSMMVPILLVLGAPITLALRALPAAGRDGPPGPREWIVAAVHSPVARFLTHPLVASALFVGSFYVLYLGGVFGGVVTYHAAHLAMNLHFLVTGYLFYWVVIGIDPAPRKVAPVVKVAMVFGSLPFHAFFGVTLMSMSTVIADGYYRTLHLPWSIDLLSDQRTGGGIAWAAGEVPLVVVLLALLVQWTRQDRRQARQFDRRASRDDDSDLARYNAMLARLSGRQEPSRPADVTGVEGGPHRTDQHDAPA
ncbi:cytochrome c oxidase assembly protein [Williamsia sterculiae]|uniref:Putative copper resistance protein D n=1 Tax=Williamsia sterculiae TaxID=1344003 RepID=A0A1N7GKD9_9NOCA|nr:cytochrome c oxidase assembly protein [Williamsia sterculiae]SIS13047.1 putative copper resistance protein D [Williamsia sterculiae]